MGSCYISIITRDKKITCSNCGKIISALKVKEHFFECIGKKSWK
jgi:hypothetical protein